MNTSLTDDSSAYCPGRSEEGLTRANILGWNDNTSNDNGNELDPANKQADNNGHLE